jgi:hypothetical protein
LNTLFPENIFSVPKNKSAIYKHKLITGESIAKNKSIIFCGICRDVEHYLSRNIECINRTSKLFKNSFTFIYENDSKDQTVNILKRYKSENFAFVSDKRSDKNYRADLDNGVDPWHQNRCKILADCRNKYMNAIQPMLDNYDYVCVLDLDVKGGWSYDGIKHGIFTLESHEDYGCVTSYGVLAEKHGNDLLENHNINNYIMYDSLAFRPLGWDFGVNILRTPMFNNICFKRGDDPVEVRSNFGGLAIYKSSAIKNKTYDSKVWAEGSVDPDHVELHKQMLQDKWKIILDPSMIVSYSPHKHCKVNNDKYFVAN